MTSSWLRERPVEWVAGQLIVGGFEGSSLPGAFAEALTDGRRGGAILFRRNLPDLEAARALCREIAVACSRGEPPFIGVDEEGGRVTRLPKPFAHLPSMRVLAAEGEGAVREAARRVGAALREIGFNLDFAPVLDVDSNPNNPVIGDRSFGSDPDRVGAAGVAFAEGLLSSRIIPCGKHFPGHGDTDVDSHLALPIIRHPLARLRSVEWPPFVRAIEAGIPALMSAHVLCESLDPERIGTLSREVGTRWLRRELGFTGFLFSDDLEMKAVTEACRNSGDEAAAIGRAAVLAVRAGCDAVLICKRWDAQEEAHRALAAEASRDEAFRDRMIEAAWRGLELRRRFGVGGDDTERGFG